MKKRESLLKNSILLSIAQIVAHFINFLFLPIYTKYLSNSEYGYVDLYNTIRSVFSCLAFLGIEHAIFMYYISTKEESEKKEYLSTGIIISVILLTLYSIIYWILSTIYNYNYASLLFLYFFVYEMYYLMLHIARALEKLKEYAFATALATIIIVPINICLLTVMRMGVKGILIGNIFAYSIVLIYLLAKVWSYHIVVFFINIQKAKQMLVYSLPIVLNNSMGWVMSSSDRMIISAKMGIAFNGIYAVANKFFSIINLIGTAFNIAWAETAAKEVSEIDHNKYFYKIICMIMDVGFLVISGIIVILPYIFKYLVNITFSDAYYQIPILVYAGFWWAAAGMIGHILLAFKRSLEYGIGSFFIAIVNVIINLLFIKSFGLYAASFSTLISCIFLFVYRFLRVKKIDNICIPIKKIIIQSILFGVLCTRYYTSIKLINYVIITIFIVYIFIIIKRYNDELRVFIDSIKQKVTGIQSFDK